MSEKNERIYAAYERVCKERDDLLAAAEMIEGSEQVGHDEYLVHRCDMHALRAAIARAKGE